MNRTDLWRAVGVAAAVLVLAVVAILLYAVPRTPETLFSIEGLQEGSPLGTPGRAEREFKLSLEFAAGVADLTDDGLREVQADISRALSDDLAAHPWSAPSLSGSPYEVDRDPTQIVMRDFYLDTEDAVLLDNVVALRLRYRFDTGDQLLGHEAAPTVRRYFPFRAEVQAKVDRVDLGGGFSTANEARLEFRAEAPPFSEGRTPPPAPWPVEEFLPVAQTGLYEDSPTTPGALLARSLEDSGLTGQVRLVVALVAVSTRTRLHMNMKTEYGSGPNPEQAFLLSLDRTDVYDGRIYQEYLEAARLGGIPRPAPAGTFYEMEIEFERNVSTRVDEAIARDGNAAVIRLRDAFLEDQQRIRQVVAQVFAARGIRTSDGDRNKYQRASGLLAP